MKVALLQRCLAPLAVAACLVAPAVATAGPDREEPGDGLLLDGLNDLLEGLPPAEAPDPGPAPTPGNPLRPRPPAPPGEDLGRPPRSPLDRIEQGMAESRRLIAARDASGGASRTQKQVIADLDALIREAEKNRPSPSPSPSESQARQQSRRSQPKPGEQQPGDQPGQQAGAQQNAQQAGQRSTARLGSATGAEMADRPPTELMKQVWGSLPQRLREQMLESSSDEFLPGYREEIEAYFRRLAEEPPSGPNP